jgi:RNA polymerase sigma-70 factor (ECF subfamily)
VDEAELRTLALAAQEGDERAFEALVRRLTRSLVALAFRYTSDWDAAGDLAQETWIRVYRSLGRWDPKRPFTGWLHTIHRNVCRDHVRRPWERRQESRPVERIQRLEAPGSHAPDALLEAREFRERVMEAARGLSPSQQEVFLRVDVEEEDQRTVARELGIRYGTLRVTLHTARRRLAEWLRTLEGRT